MKNFKFFKFLSLILSFVIVISLFAACSFKKEEPSSSGATSQKTGEEKILDKSPLAPKERDNHLTPDTSKTEVKKATKKSYNAKTEEEFVEALENFANPNGNEYDALAILGNFDYGEKEDELLKRFKTASADWHAQIVEKVGSKCVVDIVLKDKASVDKSDVKVSDWETINGMECEAFSNIKCTIATNYAKDTITLSLDIVKLNGNWHFATVASIDKVLNAITTGIY
ncbi:MAG: hypothetical protein IKJ68_02935 [Clostridia bacterium]|nr:hypothetical protein [Clostridia bacterium]